MSETPFIGCGLDALTAAYDPAPLANLVAQTARWVNPAAYRDLPLWYPNLARKQPLYKARWSEPQLNNKLPKFEGNTHANKALTKALGVTSKARPNWTCCHIWGNDDATYQSASSEVNDPRYFSCIANMVLLPVPLKSFTDTIPELKFALRWAAFKLYGFVPDGRDVPTASSAGAWMPQVWAGGSIPGVMPVTPVVKRRISERFETIKADFVNSPGCYPKEQVYNVAAYWRMRVPDSLFKDKAFE